MINKVEVIEFELSEEYIHLIKLLKLLGLVESGADAKIAVEEGEVKFNGEIEFRKRKKIRSGDSVLFGNTQIQII